MPFSRYSEKLQRLVSRVQNRGKKNLIVPVLGQTVEEPSNGDADENTTLNFNFLSHVVSIVAEHDEDEIEELWCQARAEAWSEGLGHFHNKVSTRCKNCRSQSETLRLDRSHEDLSLSSSVDGEELSQEHSANIQLQQSYNISAAASTIHEDSSGTTDEARSSIHGLGIEQANESDFSGPNCPECSIENPEVFPYVSDAAAVAVIVFLHVMEEHPELSFTPMIPRASSEEAEYLDSGASFSVTRVSWEQFRGDTSGRKWTDAVYKRVKPAAPRKAWLYFLKDLIVTHHMSFHASESQKGHVVKLLGVGWEPTFDDEDLKAPTPLPVIALEYAHYGTLQNLFYSSSFASSYKNKKELLLDVAEGLLALHNAGIVHGDVKPQNILVFKHHTERGTIAKLSDFGFSVIDPDSGPELQALPGGTYPYTAPEASHLIPRAELRYTDVYSFGVVIWQTLLHGRSPFFSSRYQGGESLDRDEVDMLKTGQHTVLAGLYDVELHEHMSGRQCQTTAPRDQDQWDEFLEDPLNDLLVAMATEALTDLDEYLMPRSDLPEILAVLQITMSSNPSLRRLDSCRIILGGKYRQADIISVLNWEKLLSASFNSSLNFHTYMSRTRFMFASMLEKFFISLSRQSGYRDVSALGHWDRVFASRLGSALLEYHIREYLAGDRSEGCIENILQALKVSSAAGNTSICAAALGIHQHLRKEIENLELFAHGTALALLRGDNACVQQARRHASPRLRNGVTKLQELSVNTNCTQEETNTALHLACQAGDHDAVLKLLKPRKVSAGVPNLHGEEPIHWLHTFTPSSVERVVKALVKAGADVDCVAGSCLDKDLSGVASISIFPTPLLRAIVRRNPSAVKALVEHGANVSKEALSVAASMLQAESLEILLVAERSPPDEEDWGLQLWEKALHGMSVVDRLKFHGGQYNSRVRATYAVLTKYVGNCYILPGPRYSLEYAVTQADLNWIEMILETLYADPRRAILSELQKGLLRAIVIGRHQIFSKIMEYGALPLLPEAWHNSQLVAGVPNKWSASLIEFLMRSVENVAQTSCGIHLCATAGQDGRAIAKEIVEIPVRNSCLMPALPVESNGPHFITRIIEGWRFPGIDRGDENGKTTLYWAISNGEFELAEYLLSQGASKDISNSFTPQGGRSIAAEILLDRKGYLSKQLEFLLDRSNGALPSFYFRETVVGEQQPATYGVISFSSMPSKEATIITAAVQACQGLDAASKVRMWNAILKVFHQPTQILARPQGMSALQLAVQAADAVTLDCLVRKLRDSSFSFTPACSIIDRIRDRLIDDAPPKIADARLKEKVVRYRRSLGDMISTMREAGDRGLSERRDLLNRILDTTNNEYPILALGFEQLGEGLDSIEQFRSDTLRFLEAFLATLYCCRSRENWLHVVEGLEAGWEKLLAPYFRVKIERWEHNNTRKEKLKLIVVHNPKQILFNQQSPRGQHATTVNSMFSQAQWTTFKRLSLTPKVPLTTLEQRHYMEGEPRLASLGFGHRGNTVSTLSPEEYTSSLLSGRNPNRVLRREPAIFPDNNNNNSSSTSNDRHISQLHAQIQEGIARRDYTAVVQQLNQRNGMRDPTPRSHFDREIRQMRDLVVAHVHNRVEIMTGN